jgi:hypothetical protein
MKHHCLLRRYLNFLYVYDFRTSQETHLWASTVCYVGIFIFLYVADVSTSQEAPVGLHGLLQE